jgi:hypothetical protein
LPDKITFDDAVTPAERRGITFDDALQGYQQPAAQPGRLFQQLPQEAAPAKNVNFGATLKASLVEDEGTKRRLIAESLFPGDPKGIERVGFVGGTPAYLDETGELRKVSPGLARFGAGALASAPEAIGGAVGAMAGPVGAAAGAVGARGLKRAAAGLAFDEPQTIKGNMLDLAGEGVLNLASGGLAKGGTKFLDRGKTVDFGPTNARAAEQTVQQTKARTGIDLDLAQASGDRKLIALRAYAARYPGKSAEIIQAADDAAQGQFETAANRVLDLIATGKPSDVAGQNGVNAAQMVLAAAGDARDKAVQPFYDQARKVVLAADVVEAISKDPLAARAAKRIAKDPVYQRKLEGLPENSVGYWQQVKRNLDSGYSTAERAGDGTAAREYADAAKKLNEKLAAASPEYKAANEFYAKATKETLEPLEQSVVGILAKIDNPKAATAAAKIFSDANVTPSQIVQARSLIAAKSPGAWNDLTRQWLGDKLNKAMKETQAGDVTNVAGKFRQAVFGTPADKAKMQAMLPTGAAQAFDDLMSAAEKLASTPIAGSNTMRDTEIKDQLKGTGAVVFKWLTSPRAAITDAAEQRALENGTTQIAEALLNPQKRAQLKQVVKMAPSTRQAIMISTILAGQVPARVAASSGDTAPPALERSQR